MSLSLLCHLSHLGAQSHYQENLFYLFFIILICNILVSILITCNFMILYFQVGMVSALRHVPAGCDKKEIEKSGGG